MKRILDYAATCCLLLSSAGCGDDTPQCSGSSTIAILHRIIDEQKHFKEALIEGSDAKSADYEIIDIITTGQTAKEASCKAAISMSITLKSGETKTMRIPGTFTYTADLTDDGKLYVEASGL